MLYIITGEIDSGKTFRLLKLYKKHKNADGYALIKAFENNNYIGQNILWLDKSITEPFSRISPGLPFDWIEQESYKEYSFSSFGLTFMAKIYNSLFERLPEAVFIDDIGPLELVGGGAADMFSTLLHVKTDIYVSVRQGCIEEFLRYFSIRNDEYTLI
ncbi:MAG: hypothetical protein EOM87_01655 [Clostridia bacterium]|nr:hypothetical protein [Clostridia bacterium]